MAQGDLYRLLKRISIDLAKDMESSKGGGSERFRARVDRLPHDVYLDRDQIKNEILIQLQDFNLSKNLGVTQGIRQTVGSASGRSRQESAMAVQAFASAPGLTDAQIIAAEKEAETMLKLANKLPFERRRGINISKVGGDGVSTLVLRFTPTSKTAIVYDAVNELIFKPAKSRLSKTLAAAKFDLSSDQQKRIFNVGHVTAVSTLKAARAVGRVQRGIDRVSKKYPDPLSTAAADKVKLDVLSKFSEIGNPEFLKNFLMKASVRVESEATNLTDSDYEAALLRDVRKTLEQLVKQMPIDWANQKSSDSLIDAISKDLMQTATKRGAKVAGLKSKDFKTNSATQTVTIKKQKLTPKILAQSDFDLTIPNLRSTPSPIKLSTLLPVINERLPEVVKSNMGIGGRLKNRTGRFANSAEVVAIDDETLTVGYTYQKNPYQVFEAQGARDPRPLIEQSIREIAVSMMQTRFNLRRI